MSRMARLCPRYLNGLKIRTSIEGCAASDRIFSSPRTASPSSMRMSHPHAAVRRSQQRLNDDVAGLIGAKYVILEIERALGGVDEFGPRQQAVDARGTAIEILNFRRRRGRAGSKACRRCVSTAGSSAFDSCFGNVAPGMVAQPAASSAAAPAARRRSLALFMYTGLSFSFSSCLGTRASARQPASKGVAMIAAELSPRPCPTMRQ